MTETLFITKIDMVIWTDMKTLKTFTGTLDEFMSHTSSLNSDEYVEFFDKVKTRQNKIEENLTGYGVPQKYARNYAIIIQRLIDDGLIESKTVDTKEFFDLTSEGSKKAHSFGELVDLYYPCSKHLMELTK